jgi:hypothetical protein
MFSVNVSFGQVTCPPHECNPCDWYIRICNETQCELNFVYGYDDICDGVIGLGPFLPVTSPPYPCYPSSSGWYQPLCRKFCEDGSCICPNTFQLILPGGAGTVDPWGPPTSWVCPNPPDPCVLTYEVLPPDNMCCQTGESLKVDVTPGNVLYEAEFRFYCEAP